MSVPTTNQPLSEAPVILSETDLAALVIAGQTVGHIRVADLLPRAPRP
jgi:hypothetical protein